MSDPFSISEPKKQPQLCEFLSFGDQLRKLIACKSVVG
jgi:hypothetical protein